MKVVTLSRNFGHQAAISAGLEHARGDVVVMIDGDLQDPPELIPEMLDAWRRGADVVYAVRESREGETRFKLATARWFYRVFAKLARIELAQDSGDFRLMDRAPLDALLSMPERNRFLRGMTVWVGFTQTAVTYRREARAGGRTKFTPGAHAALRVRRDHELLARAAAGRDAARASRSRSSRSWRSRSPSSRATRTSTTRGVPSTIVIILLLGGIQLITVGIIGEYVGRIYDEVKHRPLYVVRDRVNVEAPDRAGARRHDVRIAVLGAGVCGLVAAHRLARAGHAVDVYERWPGLGGQAATLDVGDGHRLERYYHHLFTSDRHIAALFARARDAGRDRVAAVERRVLRARRAAPVRHAARPAALPAALAARARADGRRRARAAAASRATARRTSGSPRASGSSAGWAAQAWEEVWGPLLRGKFGERADDDRDGLAVEQAAAAALRRRRRRRARSGSATRATRGSRCSRRSRARSRPAAGAC